MQMLFFLETKTMLSNNIITKKNPPLPSSEVNVKADSRN